ncbi:MAG: Lrp/AsnC family transcriptional regulator [Methanosarcinales archaeon]
MDENSLLEIIQEREDGILQNELWRVAGIDSRKCSRLVKRLLDKNLVTREAAVSRGSRTYLLRARKGVSFEVESLNPDLKYLIANGEFSPCVGCRRECDPRYCEDLTEWIANLLAEES